MLLFLYTVIVNDHFFIPYLLCPWFRNILSAGVSTLMLCLREEEFKIWHPVTCCALCIFSCVQVFILPYYAALIKASRSETRVCNSLPYGVLANNDFFYYYCYFINSNTPKSILFISLYISNTHNESILGTCFILMFKLQNFLPRCSSGERITCHGNYLKTIQSILSAEDYSRLCL